MKVSPPLKRIHVDTLLLTPMYEHIMLVRHLVVQLVYSSYKKKKKKIYCSSASFATVHSYVFCVNYVLLCYCCNSNVSFVERECSKNFFFCVLFSVSPQRPALKRKHKQRSVMQRNEVQKRARGEEKLKVQRLTSRKSDRER